MLQPAAVRPAAGRASPGLSVSARNQSITQRSSGAAAPARSGRSNWHAGAAEPARRLGVAGRRVGGRPVAGRSGAGVRFCASLRSSILPSLEFLPPKAAVRMWKPYYFSSRKTPGIPPSDLGVFQTLVIILKQYCTVCPCILCTIEFMSESLIPALPRCKVSTGSPQKVYLNTIRCATTSGRCVCRMLFALCSCWNKHCAIFRKTRFCIVSQKTLDETFPMPYSCLGRTS